MYNSTIHPIFELFQVEEVPVLHVVIEAILVIVLVYLFTTKKYRKKVETGVKLTKKEEQQLLDDFEPESLVPDVSSNDCAEGFAVEGKFGQVVTVNGNENVVNVATYNFLGLVTDDRIEKEAVRSIRQYGVGSCGPRGFYGTIDCHEELEEKIAAFMGAEECILYSYGFATVASAIPAYSKRGDLIFCDESVCFSIQKGLDASRSTVVYFKHNDMNDLEDKLKAQQKIDNKDPVKAMATRRFIVVEGIYVNTGSICPIDKLVELKYKYKSRLLVEESLSFGVLGKKGRGVTEEYGIDINDVDVIAVSMGASLGSVGGFCCGRRFVIDHQRLSGQGYCFSASLPPLLANAAILSLSVLASDEGSDLLSSLRDNIEHVRARLTTGDAASLFSIRGDKRSPMIHIIVKGVDSSLSVEDKDAFLRRIALKACEHGIFISPCSYIRKDEIFNHEPSLRLCVSAKHTSTQLDNAIKGLIAATKSIE
eukprot:m.37990 g.37990  ORF g.37990 m.37990 type:complete len:480 (+) comp6771_c0_seq3:445-1884(+)